MAHIKLKSLVEQVTTEATLFPVRSQMKEIEGIILKYLTDKEKSSKLGRELKGLYYGLLTRDFLGIGGDFNELNHRLKKYNIRFSTLLPYSTRGGISKNGNILINANHTAEDIEKKDGKWDFDALMTTIGHELIHREQYLRGMDKAQYSQRGDGGEEAYLNNPAEVMTWAYSIIKVILYKNPNITLPEVIKYLQTNEDVAEFLNQYTRTNRQKIVKHMIEYAKKLLDEK